MQYFSAGAEFFGCTVKVPVSPGLSHSPRLPPVPVIYLCTPNFNINEKSMNKKNVMKLQKLNFRLILFQQKVWRE